MASKRPLTVRSRILTAVVLISAVAFALVGFSTYLVQRQLVLDQIDTKLVAVISQFEHVAETAPINDQEPNRVRELMVAVMERAVVDHNSSIVGVIDGSPRLTPAMEVSFRLESEIGLLSRVTEELSAADYSETILGTWNSSEGVTLRYLAIPVLDSSETTKGYLLTAYNLNAEMAEIDQTFRVFAFASTGALILVALVAFYVSGRLLGPIRTLTNTASKIHASDLSARIPVTGNDDVSELTKTINSMFDRIESGVVAQQQLIRDVRHELRTPITIMRGNAELLNSSDPVEVSETRAVLLEELDRLSNLVTDLTVLAEVSEHSFISPTWVDFATYFDRLKIKSETLVTNSDKEFRALSELSGNFWFDQERITQVILQLVENAVKYSQPGTQITLQAFTEQGEPYSPQTLVLSVGDTGAAIPAENNVRIFQRFYRMDNTGNKPGSGLGLSIASSILHSHGGKISLDAGEESGNTFTCYIPQPSPEVTVDQEKGTTE